MFLQQFLGDLAQDLQLLLVIVDSGQLLGVVVMRGWMGVIVIVLVGVAGARPGLSLVGVFVRVAGAAAVTVAMAVSATGSCKQESEVAQ